MRGALGSEEDRGGKIRGSRSVRVCVCEEVVAGKAKRRVAGLFEIIMQLAALF